MKVLLISGLLIAGLSVNLSFAQSGADRKHIEKALIDSVGNVHIIYSTGEDVPVTQAGRCEDLKVNKTRQSAAWVHRGTVEDAAGKVIEEFRAEIVVYQSGRSKNVIPGNMTIWKWNFWDDGKKIAFATGPTHGNPIFKLFDLESGQVVDECRKPDSDDCPPWAKDL